MKIKHSLKPRSRIWLQHMIIHTIHLIIYIYTCFQLYWTSAMFSSGLIHTYFAAQFGSLAVSWVEEPGTLVTNHLLSTLFLLLSNKKLLHQPCENSSRPDVCTITLAPTARSFLVLVEVCDESERSGSMSSGHPGQWLVNLDISGYMSYITWESDIIHYNPLCIPYFWMRIPYWTHCRQIITYLFPMTLEVKSMKSCTPRRRARFNSVLPKTTQQ